MNKMKIFENTEFGKIQTTIRIPVALKSELQRAADIKGYTITDLATFILSDYIHESNVQE